MKTDRELLIELVAAVKMLTTCGDINLGDLTYNVREREGKGWEGPNVKQWSDGVTRTEKALKEAEEHLR